MQFVRSNPLLSRPGARPFGPCTVNWAKAPRGLQVFFLNTSTNFSEVALNSKVTTYNGAPRLTLTLNGFAFDPFANSINASTYVKATAPTQCSMEALVFCANASAAFGFGRMSNSLPDDGTMDRSLEQDVTGHPQFYIFDGGAKIITATNAMSVGNFYHIVATSSGSFLNLYVNGASAASAVATSNGGYTGFSTPVISQGYGNSNSGGSASSRNPILHFAFANRAWTAQEVLARYLDMYDFLVPTTPQYPVGAAAVGGSFIPAWAMNSNLPVIGTGTY